MRFAGLTENGEIGIDADIHCKWSAQIHEIVVRA